MSGRCHLCKVALRICAHMAMRFNSLLFLLYIWNHNGATHKKKRNPFSQVWICTSPKVCCRTQIYILNSLFNQNFCQDCIVNCMILSCIFVRRSYRKGSVIRKSTACGFSWSLLQFTDKLTNNNINHAIFKSKIIILRY